MLINSRCVCLLRDYRNLYLVLLKRNDHTTKYISKLIIGNSVNYVCEYNCSYF